jgi:hypothetical protein
MIFLFVHYWFLRWVCFLLEDKKQGTQKILEPVYRKFS